MNEWGRLLIITRDGRIEKWRGRGGSEMVGYFACENMLISEAE